MNPDQDLLYVLATRLNNPEESWNAFQTTALWTLRAETLEFLDEQPVDFGFQDYDLAAKRPYYMGTWEAAGGPNTGGLAVLDGTDAALIPRFVASAINPAAFNPAPVGSKPYATFQWLANSRGTFVESVGGRLPIPLFRTHTGFLGAWQGSLPDGI